MTSTQVLVGRQPIFDADFAVVGYEVLHSGSAGPGDTRQLLFDTVGVGVWRLVGDGLLFLDFDRAVVVEGIPVLLPATSTVLEIDARQPVDAELLAGLEALVSQGFRIALDHVGQAELDERLLALAFLVKVERAAATPMLLERICAACPGAAPGFVALGVETPEDLESCAAAGFRYFQGSLLSRPQAITGEVPRMAGRSRLTRAAELAGSECSAADLEEAIRGEPAMVYQLLQMAAVGAHHGMRGEVTSVRQALVLLGWVRVHAWLSFLLATADASASEEEVLTVLVRARMCELLAEQLDPAETELAFTAGMISAFDAMLDLDLEDILAQLTSDGPLRDAVRQGATPVGDIVADVIACQLGERVGRTGLSDLSLHAASVEALRWALDVVRATGLGAGHPALTPR